MVNIAKATQVAAIARAIVFAVTPARPRARAVRGNSVACAGTGSAVGVAIATAVVSRFAVTATSAAATAVVNLAIALNVAITRAIVFAVAPARPRARAFRGGSVAFAVTVAALGGAIATYVVSGAALTATTAAATAVRVVATIDVLAQDGHNLAEDHRHFAC